MGVKPNRLFRAYSHLFENLVKTTSITSNFPVVTASILLDASRIMSVTKASDKEYRIKMYCIQTMKIEFAEEIKGHYIKMKDVEQNLSSTRFAAAYNDDGVFKLRSFGRVTRTHAVQ